MKLTKALFLTTLVAGRLLICDSASAQDSTNMTASADSTPSTNAVTHGGNFRAPNMDKIAQSLNLTDAQKTQVQPILNDQFQKMQALRQDDSLSADDKKAQMKQIRQSTAEQLKSILTPDQYAKWQSMMMHHRKQQSSTSGNGQSTQPQSAQ